MQLAEFRVQNYKIVEDTGWIPVQNLTVFVGKNESGKSAIFRALSKLNPSDGEGYDGLKEFPRQRYAAEITRSDWPVASGRFTLTPDEQRDIAAISELCREVTQVEVTRHYTGTYSITYQPDVGVDLVTPPDLIYAIDSAIEHIRNLIAPEGKGEALGRIKEGLLIFLEEQKNTIPIDGQVQKRQIAELINAVKSRANEPWEHDVLDPVTEPMYRLVRQMEIFEGLMAANRYVIEHLPKFIYFDQYSVIESAIHIPTFIATLKSHPDSPGLRATNCLFRHVNLDLDQLDRLGSHKNAVDENPIIRRQVDERSILLSTASNLMSKKFEDWWGQRKIRFRYDIDGDYFRVWVSDDLDQSEIELEQRSAGLQYFFSFYLIFLVESGDTYQDSILLLDEPGLQLHPSAQQGATRFFQRISEQNQLFYSTHSPFMIDLDHLDRVRTVYEGPGGTTKVSVDEWPADRESLFPLEAALASRIAEKTLTGGNQLIVEDIHDLWLLQAMNYALRSRGKAGLDPSVRITPAGGAANLIPLALMMSAHKKPAAVLLPGSNIPSDVLEKFPARHFRQGHGLVFYSNIVHKQGAGIEDFFSPELYFRCVKEIYPDLLLGQIPEKTPTERTDERGYATIVVEIIERRQGEQFERWRIAEILSDRICESPQNLDDETLDRFSRLFDEINHLAGST
ncbi:MAG: AAA family ATPase [Methanomicrobiales archaeon]|nr:AAA family ATPase [Methanomicrobiales archaeon]